MWGVLYAAGVIVWLLVEMVAGDLLGTYVARTNKYYLAVMAQHLLCFAGAAMLRGLIACRRGPRKVGVWGINRAAASAFALLMAVERKST